METIRLIVIVFSIMGICYFAFHFSMIMRWIRKQECGLPFRLSNAPGWAIKHYINWCEENNAPIDYSRLDKFGFASKVFLVSIVLLAVSIISRSLVAGNA